jgi:hypothetical protein
MRNKIIKAVTILIVCLVTNTTVAQSIFEGTWEYQQGNDIFRVILWEDSRDDGSDVIKGHYEKVSVDANGNETFIFSSDKDKFLGANTSWLPFIIYSSGNNQKISGSFTDNTVDQNLFDQQKRGKFRMTILSNSGGNNSPITAKWEIEEVNGAKIKESPNFSVPTNVILTKSNN